MTGTGLTERRIDTLARALAATGELMSPEQLLASIDMPLTTTGRRLIGTLMPLVNSRVGELLPGHTVKRYRNTGGGPMFLFRADDRDDAEAREYVVRQFRTASTFMRNAMESLTPRGNSGLLRDLAASQAAAWTTTVRVAEEMQAAALRHVDNTPDGRESV